jgi:hypothetical protein
MSNGSRQGELQHFAEWIGISLEPDAKSCAFSAVDRKTVRATRVAIKLNLTIRLRLSSEKAGEIPGQLVAESCRAPRRLAVSR